MSTEPTVAGAGGLGAVAWVAVFRIPGPWVCCPTVGPTRTHIPTKPRPNAAIARFETTIIPSLNRTDRAAQDRRISLAVPLDQRQGGGPRRSLGRGHSPSSPARPSRPARIGPGTRAENVGRHSAPNVPDRQGEPGPRTGRRDGPGAVAPGSERGAGCGRRGLAGPEGGRNRRIGRPDRPTPIAVDGAGATG